MSRWAAWLAVQAAGPSAAEVDQLMWLVTGVGVFFFVLTQGVMVYFIFRYRRPAGQPPGPTPAITHHLFFETTWIVVPTLVVIAIFGLGLRVFDELTIPRPEAWEINVTAKQWLWEFHYPDGRIAVNQLRVPRGEYLKLVLTSEDVIHSFYLPDFRTKVDVLPGRYTTLYIKPETAGEYQVFCAEFCGTSHSAMLAKLVVLEPEAYRDWQAGVGQPAEGTPVERGKNLVQSNGCAACHSLDGSVLVGPSFQGVFGRTAEFADGSKLTVDEDYLRESITDPQAKLVQGFPPVMPTYKATLSGDDIAAIIAYLKTLN